MSNPHTKAQIREMLKTTAETVNYLLRAEAVDHPDLHDKLVLATEAMFKYVGDMAGSEKEQLAILNVVGLGLVATNISLMLKAEDFWKGGDSQSKPS